MRGLLPYKYSSYDPTTSQRTKNQEETPVSNANLIDRRHLIRLGALGLAAPALVGRASAQAKFTCRIAHTEAIGAPITVAFEKWAGILRERSGGRIDAQHFPAAQLGGLAQALEGSRMGTIQVTTAGPDSEEAVAPEIAVLGGAPGFIYRDEAHVDRVLQGPLGQQASEIARKKTGVEFVAYGETGFRHILSKRPVASLDDLKGPQDPRAGAAHLGRFLAPPRREPDAAALFGAILGPLHRRHRRARLGFLLDCRLQVA
jgi:C4-dicarboxylate-binding protein DctP